MFKQCIKNSLCTHRSVYEERGGRVLESGLRDGASPEAMKCVLQQIQEGLLSVTIESMCTKFWLTA